MNTNPLEEWEIRHAIERKSTLWIVFGQSVTEIRPTAVVQNGSPNQLILEYEHTSGIQGNPISLDNLGVLKSAFGERPQMLFRTREDAEQALPEILDWLRRYQRLCEKIRSFAGRYGLARNLTRKS